MAVQSLENDYTKKNPLDLLEEIVKQNRWPFSRTSEKELVARFSGNFCEYNLCFGWVSTCSSMQFSCSYDLRVPERKIDKVSLLICLINDRLVMGHFNLSPHQGELSYRYTIPLRGLQSASVEQLEDIVDYALSESERYYSSFQHIMWGGGDPNKALQSAILETVGEA
jgi:hypothetical protein|tara:strand:- start:987 stop:1490 length:504 start_codon:yes stop_codon:yes gene_type:complete